ncbi:MAG: prolipoprotein diacylglyceryl transferase [Polyangiaceae bacterium]|nr:prolipoprotein diacylglyceryl transferase [Polyangiaceae bacterium]
MLPNFTWDIDPILASIGPFQFLSWSIGPLELRYYSLLFVFVFLGGYQLLRWQVVRGGGDEEDAGDFIVYGVIAVLAGARIGHVLFYDLDKAVADPVWILKIWTGGLASHGAVLGLILGMYWFTKRRDIAFLEGSDRFAFSAALGATLVRIGNFFNSEIVGRPTDQTWGVRFPRFDARALEPQLRHPSQLYETALGLLVMLALYLADRAWGKEKRPRGALISLFFTLYFPGRFLIEFVKETQGVDDGWSLTMGQWLSIPGMLLGIYGLTWAFKHRLPVGWKTREQYLIEARRALEAEEEEDTIEADEEERRRRRRKARRKARAAAARRPAAEGADTERPATGDGAREDAEAPAGEGDPREGEGERGDRPRDDD